jgi:hypothetical protein
LAGAGKDTFESHSGNRSVAGLDFTLIKGSLLNFVRFLVPDTEEPVNREIFACLCKNFTSATGSEAGNIVYHVEFRRLSKAEKDYSAAAKSLPVGKTYAFLMLMGPLGTGLRGPGGRGGAWVYK